MKKVLLSTLAAATLLAGNFTGTTPKAEAGAVDTAKNIITAVVAKFKDVSGHWAESVIAKAYDLKLISGYEDGTFRPNGQITRAEFAAILSRATKLPTATGSDPFNDMKGHWAESAVTQLVAQGFINPSDYPNGFNPNTQLTRYEMMKWIANGLMKSNASFKQAFEDTKNTLLPTPEAVKGQISADKVPYMALVRGTDIITGFEDGSLRPQNTTTRAEVAAILLRYMDVEGKDASSYQALNELREVGTTGTNLTSISNYHYSNGSAKIPDLSKITSSAGVLKINRLIVVDARTDTPKGVYAPLFLAEGYKTGAYRTFVDVSFTSNLPEADIITINKGFANSLVTFNRLNRSLAEEHGLVTLPGNPRDFLQKGKEKRFWITSSLRADGWGYFLQSDTGGNFSIQNK
ncbi:S-layer homology domain-containing protein [Paenibacillus naphthalenovorans]|uniref:SLH domain-containing protein n=1 Tax=Paenibacillus naphthalenovorans TaxID=162209 RepID=A0A0U2N1Z8_9BACL|nr:S-layer homology domain-containing protein [Paenibacillus naphthalenovorans]ALS25071.1 SLH domain-containing protein [Paenibacillus naphthalenovorans]GCL74788.1 S-layer homology domain-containing protein [Paenibacillus naphthalenovorans]